MEENYSLINLMLFQYREEQCKTLCNSPLSLLDSSLIQYYMDFGVSFPGSSPL